MEMNYRHYFQSDLYVQAKYYDIDELWLLFLFIFYFFLKNDCR